MRSLYAISNVRAQPILKWAGGKSQLLAQLTRHVPVDFEFYHEPFVGGGALFFELVAQGRIRSACLSDINASLIGVYMAVRDCVDDVIYALRQHHYDEERFYAVRAMKTERLSLAERAARIIFLNKTCYNGLYRENLAGEFNVPFGRYKNPTRQRCSRPPARPARERRLQPPARPNGLAKAERGNTASLPVVFCARRIWAARPE